VSFKRQASVGAAAIALRVRHHPCWRLALAPAAASTKDAKKAFRELRDEDVYPVLGELAWRRFQTAAAACSDCTTRRPVTAAPCRRAQQRQCRLPQELGG